MNFIKKILDFIHPTRALIRDIKARGHWNVNLRTGVTTWIPGTWSTPYGPDEKTDD